MNKIKMQLGTGGGETGSIVSPTESQNSKSRYLYRPKTQTNIVGLNEQLIESKLALNNQSEENKKESDRTSQQVE